MKTNGRPNAEPLSTLRLLEALAEPGRPTQRELSRRAGISLGLTNLLLERMARRAWVKLSTMPGRRMIYALTPSGLAEKARRTRDWVRHTYRYIRETREFVIAELRAKAPPRPRVACWGQGDLTELVRDAARDAGGRLVGTVRNPEPPAEGSVDAVVLLEAPPRALRAELKRRFPCLVDLT
jgi:DNA-binding MarR family transcriptional regulator